MASLYQTSSDTSRFLSPKFGGDINVLNDYRWTLSPKEARTETVPCILHEYQPNNANLINSLYYWYMQLTNNVGQQANVIRQGNDPKLASKATGGESNLHPSQNINDPLYPYMNRFFGEPTKFTYTFPYLMQDGLSVANTFSENSVSNDLKTIKDNATNAFNARSIDQKDGSILGAINKIGVAGTIAKSLLEGVSSYKWNTIKTDNWSGTAAPEISFSFDLINTVNPRDAVKNWELCYLLNYQNHPAQRNAYLAESPCVYSVYIPNVIWIPAAHLKTFSVKNIGQSRIIQCEDENKRNIPEAYSLSFTFVSILNPVSRNILASLPENAVNQPMPLINSSITPVKEMEKFLRSPLGEAIVNSPFGKLFTDYIKSS